MLLHKYLNNSLRKTWYTCWPSGLRLKVGWVSIPASGVLRV